MTFSINISTTDRTLLQIDDFSIAENKITFLFGESGIGKSLISKAIYGLPDPNELTILINKNPYSEFIQSEFTAQIKKNSFFVFQEPSSHLNPLMKLNDQLCEGSLSQSNDEKQILSHLWNQISESDIQKIIDIFPKPYRPSGGEKQRILLAMAFKKIHLWVDSKSNESTFFIFDEPTGSLDNHFRNLFLSLLFENYSKRKFTCNLITHDYSIISEVVNKYPQLLDDIEFKELTSDDSKLSLKLFNPDQYTNWISGEKSKTNSELILHKTSDQPILKLESDLTVFGRYLSIYSDPKHETKKALTLSKGELIYLKAPSGVGKTTVAKVIMGLYKSSDFNMIIHKTEFDENTKLSVWKTDFWGTKLGMVFQHADESLNLNSTVRDSFKGLPLQDKWNDTKLTGFLNPFFGGKIDGEFLKQKIKFLSGGQKQRINLLRSMILNPDILVLDEPLNGLDFKTMLLVVDLIRKMQENGTGILLISHNEEIFESLIPKEKIYYLSAERISK